LSKAQILAGDFFFSMAIFLLVLGISMVMFNYVAIQVRNNQEEDFMHIVSLTTADLLLKTEGYPKDWNESNVKSIGLATNDLLNESKVVRFVNMSYDTAKSGLKINQYDFLITFNDINGTALNLSGINMSIGIDPVVESQVVKIHRSTIIDNGTRRIPTIISIVLWRRL